MRLGINRRGFNLFTALISFLLIMLAVLLIQTMIQTERNAADTISSIESRTQLEATAEMARADAIQVFNYALRKRIEDWLTDPERGGITLNLENRTWEEIQEEFAASKFGGEQGNQFAKFASSSLEGIFYAPDHFGKYRVSLEGSETLERVITKAIEKSVDQEFFTVIGCNGDPTGDNCPLGTFYVNLHVENLSQEEYEDLPKLRVIDNTTGEELQEVILPRTTFRIYVPLRFFKAIAEARALTHYPSGGGSFQDMDAWINTTQDYGLFSPRVHNELESMGLGMCDFGYCSPRTDPFEKPASPAISATDKFCPGDSTAPKWEKGYSVDIVSSKQWFPAGLTQYNANDNDDWKNMNDTVADIAEARACDVLQGARQSGFIDADPDDRFTLIGSECGNLAYEITVNSDARDSKIIGPEATPGSIASDPGRNLGLFSENGEVKWPEVGGVTALPCTGLTGTEAASRCAEVKSVKVTLAFREEDPNYMVRELSEDEERIYRISVFDNTYVPFTGNWQQGVIGNDYLYGQAPQITNCSMAAGQGWYCSTVRTSPELGQTSPTAGCKPSAAYGPGVGLPNFPDESQAP